MPTDLSPLSSTLILVHASLGGLALGAGFTALLSAKGGRLHRLAGRAFAGGMLLSLLLSIPAIAERGNILLGLVGPFTAWMVLRGWRVFAVQKRGETPLDRLLAQVPRVAGVGLVGLGAWASFRQGTPLGMGGVAIGLGLASLLLGRGPSRPVDRSEAVRAHIAAMVGAMIAAVTALAAVNLSDSGLPLLVIWLGPTAIGVPVIIAFSRRFAAQRS